MPNNKMERFTQRARRVLELAQQEAEHMRHAYIGTEHMLVALIMEEGGVAGRVLRNLELEPQKLRELAAELSSFPVRSEEDRTPVELSPATKRALEMAVDEARRMGHHYIGSEHLLLAVVRLEDSMALVILKRLGVSGYDVRRQTRRVLQESPVQSLKPPTIDPPLPPSLNIYTKQVELGSPARPPLVPQSYSLLQAVILKLLDMVGQGTLTLEQANELLQALQPDMKLTVGRKVALASLINQPDALDKQVVRLVVTDRASGEQHFEVSLPMTTALVNLDTLLAATTESRIATVVFESESANIKVEVRLEKD